MECELMIGELLADTGILTKFSQFLWGHSIDLAE
jgi:hypothetical protein